MDEPLVLAASILVPYALGLLLRLKGAVLAALGLAVFAVVHVADASGGASSELVGAGVLGALGGFALGWAGSLTRRLLRRRSATTPDPSPRRARR